MGTGGVDENTMALDPLLDRQRLVGRLDLDDDLACEQRLASLFRSRSRAGNDG